MCQIAGARQVVGVQVGLDYCSHLQTPRFQPINMGRWLSLWVDYRADSEGRATYQVGCTRFLFVEYLAKVHDVD